MGKVPTIVLKGLTEDDWRALTIWDNKSGLMGTFDQDLLRLELGSLEQSGFDLSLTGFSTLELTGIFSTREGLTDPDDEPDAPSFPVAQLGDVWTLGEHTLVCGDATDKAAVDIALAGSRPHLCISDPPYGTHYRSWREAWALFGGDVLYVWHSPLEALTVQQGIEAQDFDLRSQIIWRKVQPVVGPPNGQYRWQHESCFFAVRKGKNAHWTGSRKESTVWEADRPKRQDTGHSTQKPVELWRKPIENCSAVGEHVYDPFAGSGVAIIACQMTKRVAHCIEIEPGHVDRCLVRFAGFSGIAPVLAETGETFEQVKARRSEVV
jgi:DNA modification methylase